MTLPTNPHQPCTRNRGLLRGSFEGHDNKMPCSSNSLDGLYNTQFFPPPPPKKSRCPFKQTSQISLFQPFSPVEQCRKPWLLRPFVIGFMNIPTRNPYETAREFHGSSARRRVVPPSPLLDPSPSPQRPQGALQRAWRGKNFTSFTRGRCRHFSKKITTHP